MCVGGGVRTFFELNFSDLIGMADHYTQKIAICKKCGFIFTQNPFSEDLLKNRYKNFSKFEFEADDYFLEEGESYKKRCKRQKNFIEENVEDIRSLMEVGAVSGYNLSLYRDGIMVKGIEPSENNCRLAMKKYQVDMFCGTFQEYEDGQHNDKFDLIFLSHTLEHIVDPFTFILACKKINRKYIFIEVPTLDAKYLNEPFGMFGEEHVNYFTFEGLSNLMSRAGYRLLRGEMIYDFEQRLPAGWPAISTIWELGSNAENIRPVIESGALLNAYVEKNKLELERVKAYIDEIDCGERLAVWGTGHHVSMLLANTSLADKNIVLFYDSDIRKHAYRMQGREVKAFEESDIKEGRIDSIFIGTFVAQRQIMKILDPYKDRCKIYQLYD